MEKRGYLVKEGGSTVKNWRKRWFVLRGHAITYSKNPEDPTLLGTIYLEDVAAVEPTNERPSQKHVFRLRGHDNARTWYLSAANEADMKDWMAVIQRALGSDSKPRSSAPPTRFVTVECFANQGVRINGLLHPQLLGTLAHNVPQDKKRRDERGWFCNKHVPMCTILNMFAAYGWKLESVSEMQAAVPGSDKPEAASFAIFSKRLIEAEPTASQPAKPPRLTPPPVGPKPPKEVVASALPPRLRQAANDSKTRSLLGNDEEMAHLMQAMGLDDLLTS